MEIFITLLAGIEILNFPPKTMELQQTHTIQVWPVQIVGEADGGTLTAIMLTWMESIMDLQLL